MSEALPLTICLYSGNQLSPAKVEQAIVVVLEQAELADLHAKVIEGTSDVRAVNVRHSEPREYRRRFLFCKPHFYSLQE